MSTTNRLDSLLSAWNAARDAGRDPEAAELCRDCPELEPELAQRIALLRQMSALGNSPSETIAQEGPESLVTTTSLPNRIGEYHILTLLGQGGMGAVYWAEDERLRRPTAVKVMRPELAVRPGARERFFREARAAAAVEHESIVPIWHIGEDRGVPYIAMPLLRGESLAERLSRAGPLPTAEVMRLGRDVASGLGAAHRTGLIHRDIKPANIWLEQREEGWKARILDFGLARLDDDADPKLTGTGDILGTPAYMSPEQARSGKVDARADLFSLGCVLYHAATGQAPFRAATVMATLLAVAQERPADPRSLAPVPLPLANLIMRLMAKDPADRPQSASEVLEALKSLDQPNPVVQQESPQRTRPKPEPTVRHSTTLVEIPVVASASKSQLPASPEKRTSARLFLLIGVAAIVLAACAAAVYFALRPRENVTTHKGPDSINEQKRATLADLDPERIPKDEAYPWQSPELSAVIGGHSALLGAAADTTHVAISPDAKWLACSDLTGMHLWDIDTLRLHFFDLFADPVPPAFSGNSHSFALGVWRPSLKTHGARILHLFGDDAKGYRGIGLKLGYPTTAVAASSDGELIAIGSSAGEILIYHVKDPAKSLPRYTIQSGHDDLAHPVEQLMFVAEDKKIVALTRDELAGESFVRGWTVEAKAAELFKIPVAQEVLGVGVTPSSERIAIPPAGKNETELTIWDVSGKLKKSYSAPVPHTRTAEFLSSGNKFQVWQLWLGHGDSSATWSLEAGPKKVRGLAKLRDLPGETLAISPDSKRLAYRTTDGRLAIQNAQGREVIAGQASLANVDRPPVLIGNKLFTFVPTPQIWEVAGGKFVPSANANVLSSVIGPVSGSPAVAPGGGYFACRVSGTVQVYELKVDGCLKRAVLAAKSPSQAFTWGMDENTIRTVQQDGTILTWDWKSTPATNKPAGRIPNNLGSRDFVISPVAADLFVVTSDRIIYRRSLTNPMAAPVEVFKGAGPRLWPSPDGTRLALEEINGLLVVNLASNGKKTIQLPGRPGAVQWAEDCKHILVTMNGLLYVLRL